MWSAVSAIYGAWHIHSIPVGTVAHIYSTPVGTVVQAHFGTAATKHGIIGTIISLGLAFFWACAFYGVRNKAPMAWKLGWGAIVVGLLEFLYKALSSTTRIPETDHPWVASAAVIVGGSAVAFYWGLWWKRQKPYFAPRSDPMTD
jgi:hypothetical protein